MINLMQNRKRSNRKQRELLVERLHNNLRMARGNQTEPAVLEFWAVLTRELNELGCRRNVQQWQHIWNVWVSKTKTKARRLSSIDIGTAGEELSDIDEKILDIVGSASVNGFSQQEVLMSSQQSPSSPPSPRLLPPEATVPSRSQVSATPGPFRRSRPIARQRLQRRPRPNVHESLVQALNNNSRLLRQSIVQAAEILASAIRSVGLPMLLQQQHNIEDDSMQ